MRGMRFSRADIGLSRQQFKAYAMYMFTDKSLADIAQETGRSLGALRQVLKRARRNARKRGITLPTRRGRKISPVLPQNAPDFDALDVLDL